MSAVLLGHVQAGAGLDAAGGVLCRALAAQQLLGKIFLKFPWINTGNPRRKIRRGCFRYSQRKKRRERRVQRAVRASMTQIGGRMLPGPMPRNAFFIIVMPCVSGKAPTTVCMAFGMTSRGRVVPEKRSMGK